MYNTRYLLNMTKRITATYKVESDLQEYNLVKSLEALGGYITITSYNEHFENNETYKRLRKAKKDAEGAYYNFLSNN